MENKKYRYQIQVGLFRDYNKAMDFQQRLLTQGDQVEILRQGEFFAVHLGNCDRLEEAAEFEQHLRRSGFNTLLVAV